MSYESYTVLKNTLICHRLRYEKVNGIQIIQPPISQTHNGCAIAATSKQLDIQLRILYAKACPPTPLFDGEKICIIDHVKWEEEIRKNYAFTRHLESRWRPEELLNEAKMSGVPLWNGGRHVIQHSVSVYRNSKDDWNTVIKQFLAFGPYVGALVIKSDYRDHGDDIYFGTGDEKTEEYINSLGKRVKKTAYHAVTCLDFLELDGVLYVYYQNNRAAGLSRLSWMVSDNLRELHYGASIPPVHPPAALQSQKQMAAWSKELNDIRKNLDSVNNSLSLGQKLLEAAYSYMEMNKMNEIDETIKKIKGIIDDSKITYRRLDKFKSKYEGVKRAGVVPSLHLEELLKEFQTVVEFKQDLITFCNDYNKGEMEQASEKF